MRAIEELRKASGHVHYELGMLKSLTHGLASGITGQGPIHNACLESLRYALPVCVRVLVPAK